MRTAVVLGKGDLAIKVANWFLQSEQYKLAAIVPVIPEPSWTYSFANWGLANSVHVIASGHYRNLPQIAPGGEGIDLAVSVFYDKIIKAWFIDSCKKIINLHKITPGIDDGPIIAQVKYSIYPENDEVIDVYRRALEYGWTLFQQTIPLLDQITPRPQNEAESLYYSKLDDPRLGDRANFTRATSAAAPH
jgi:hypothetical protein